MNSNEMATKINENTPVGIEGPDCAERYKKTEDIWLLRKKKNLEEDFEGGLGFRVEYDDDTVTYVDVISKSYLGGNLRHG